MKWTFHSSDKPSVDVTVSQPIKEAHLWTADSTDRDLRDDKWTSENIPAKGGSQTFSASVSTPESGYRAYLAEVLLTTPSGHDYKLSTEARVAPDNIK
jgi:PhoPQ-activated pathogenicity-related protein